MSVVRLDQHPWKAHGRLSDTAPRSITQKHPERPQTLAETIPSGTHRDLFPFFKLPAELRNVIYRLVIVTGRSLIVRDMHSGEFEKSRKEGSRRSRTTYWAKDHVCDLPGGRICWLGHPNEGFIKTTYILEKSDAITDTTMITLSLNKRFREEVAFIFYGENTFQFTSMSSLMPFMKDRTVETRKYIQRLRLIFTVGGRGWNPIFAAYGRAANWNQALLSLLKLSDVKITKLCIRVDDEFAEILQDGLNFRSKPMLWLHKLSRLDNLEMLGLQYRIADPHSWLNLPPQTEEVDTEKQLWSFLAPKMLKKKADNHSPEALQQRRIWDISNASTPTSTN